MKMAVLSFWQILRCSCCRVGDTRSTDFCSPFSLLLYDFSHPDSPLKPCGYCTCLIMMKNVPFAPNLYPVAWHVFRNDLRDLWARRTCKLLKVDVAGDGSTKTNFKMNTKWFCNTYRSHPTPKTLHDTFYVMISLTFESEGYASWPFLLQVDVAGDGSTKTNFKMNTKWLWLKTNFILIDIWVIWLVSSVKE